MANICDFSMFVRGKKENIENEDIIVMEIYKNTIKYN